MDRLSDLIIETLGQRRDLRVRAEALTTYGAGSKFAMPFVFLSSLIRLLFAKLRNDVDVLHIHVAGGGSAYRKAVLAYFARGLGIPYIVHIHGSRFHETWPSANRTLRRIIDRMFTGSAEVVVLGQFWSRHVANNLPAIADRITILPNATKSAAPRDTAAPGNARVRVSFLGALGQRKGTFQLVEALGRVADLPNWEATIAGNGDVESHRALAEQAGVAARVHFPGWLGPADVDELLGRTDIFVLPSFAENLPMSILEAFAHGVAVISTPVGAIPEVIEHGRSGLIVPAGDVDALADALRRLIENPDLRLSMGQAARREHAERYDIDTYVARLARMWRHAESGR
jgi:glycosyltransferase involved in cell wall biosynthesis